ncbi:DUF2092 domain-containing protein [Joostella sp. CR20]|uniref:DUF2092 domain-containing protein n=1 Tax=Joostella sp. CR20 TaxID=2804312 RepID=UPI00313B9BC8
MKKILFAICMLCTYTAISQNNQSVIDSSAINILDKMGSYIGTLDACTFTLERSLDHEGYYGLEKHFYTDEVTMVGPNKMVVKTRGTQYNKDFMYNGEKFVYYSVDENNYCVLDAPDNIIDMIDSFHKTFGIRFPAADVFYPSLTDDMIENFDNIIYMGNDYINGVLCFHILASNDDLNVQLWIENDEDPLPAKMVIIHKDGNHNQYEATFTAWDINPEIDAEVFDFYPPEDSKLINIMAQK